MYFLKTMTNIKRGFEMTPQERKEITTAIRIAIRYLTDEELKALAAIAITKESIDGTPLTEL